MIGVVREMRVEGGKLTTNLRELRHLTSRTDRSDLIHKLIQTHITFIKFTLIDVVLCSNIFLFIN